MKMKVNLNAASKFLRTLAPGCDEFVFQTFADDGSGQLAKVLKGSFEDFAPALQKLNAKGAGIYVTINATKGEGRKASDFLRARALWADMDKGGGVKWPLDPSMIVETSPGKQHVYWLLTPESMDVETWRGCMVRIVEKYDADRKATDATRVLRLPGFYHCKGEPVQVRLIHVSKKRYSAAQLMKAFPPIMRSAPKARPTPGTATDIDIGALRSALQHLAATPVSKNPNEGTYVDCYETWTQFGLALKRDLGEPGFELWDKWSRLSVRYPGKEELRKKWDHGFKVEACDNPVHVRTIFHKAQRRGWTLAKYLIAAALKQPRNDGWGEAA